MRQSGYDRQVADLTVFREVGAVLAVVFGFAQGAAMVWDLMPASAQARVLRRCAALAYTGHALLLDLGSTLDRLAGQAEDRAGLAGPEDAEPDLPRKQTQPRRKRSGV